MILIKGVAQRSGALRHVKILGWSNCSVCIMKLDRRNNVSRGAGMLDSSQVPAFIRRMTAMDGMVITIHHNFGTREVAHGAGPS